VSTALQLSRLSNQARILFRRKRIKEKIKISKIIKKLIFRESKNRNKEIF